MITNKNSVVVVEGDGVVVTVEVGGITSHKGITNDQVVEAFGDFHGHEAQDALGDTELGHLHNIVVIGQHVVGAIECHGDVGERLNASAGGVDDDAFNERVNDGRGADNHGGS